MKKATSLLLFGALSLLSASCTTTYDAYGYPRQTVDPGVAIAGAAAAGVLGYALANNRDDDNHYHNHYHHRPRPRGYYRCH